jgi:hypothetical protein
MLSAPGTLVIRVKKESSGLHSNTGKNDFSPLGGRCLHSRCPLFARVSWEEALDKIASRFKDIMAKHGGEAILPYSHGGSLGVVHRLAGHRFFYPSSPPAVDSKAFVT